MGDGSGGEDVGAAAVGEAVGEVELEGTAEAGGVAATAEATVEVAEAMVAEAGGGTVAVGAGVEGMEAVVVGGTGEARGAGGRAMGGVAVGVTRGVAAMVVEGGAAGTGVRGGVTPTGKLVKLVSIGYKSRGGGGAAKVFVAFPELEDFAFLNAMAEALFFMVEGYFSPVKLIKKLLVGINFFPSAS